MKIQQLLDLLRTEREHWGNTKERAEQNAAMASEIQRFFERHPLGPQLKLVLEYDGGDWQEYACLLAAYVAAA